MCGRYELHANPAAIAAKPLSLLCMALAMPEAPGEERDEFCHLTN